jgi:hypothetical protein
VSRNTALRRLDCAWNQLTALDVSRNTELQFLICSFNKLQTDALNALFGTLHSNPPGEGHTAKAIRIGNNLGTATCNPNIAEAKRWIVDDVSYNVYVAGWEFNEQGNRVAVLWENFVAQHLSNNNYDAEANSVYVSGNDVYIAGWGKNAQRIDVATLWKNGVAQHLSNGNSNAMANSVFVSGSDVYVAGWEYNANNNSIAILWKNGIAQNLSNGSNDARANSVYISGSDVYVAGWEKNAQEIEVATLWKNGIPQRLSDGNEKEYANSVFVSGNDVYVAGSYMDILHTGSRVRQHGINSSGQLEFESIPVIATLWKNGIVTQRLPNENSDAEAMSVYVAGNAVYVVGRGRKSTIGEFVAKLWINGVDQHLDEDGRANSVYVVNNNVGLEVAVSNDVWVAGITLGEEVQTLFGRNRFGIATVWTNGVAQQLTDGVSGANSVFVKRNQY